MADSEASTCAFAGFSRNWRRNFGYPPMPYELSEGLAGWFRMPGPTWSNPRLPGRRLTVGVVGGLPTGPGGAQQQEPAVDAWRSAALGYKSRVISVLDICEGKSE
jgi:hypothetical protein